MAEERDDQKEPEGGDEAGRETAVDHSVVDEGAQETSAHAVPDEPPAAAGQETSVREVVPEPDPEPEPLPEPPAPDPGPPPAAAPYQPAGGTSPAAADREAADSHDSFEQKPEVFIAGAFVGAFVIGKILKRLTRGGD